MNDKILTQQAMAKASGANVHDVGSVVGMLRSIDRILSKERENISRPFWEKRAERCRLVLKMLIGGYLWRPAYNALKTSYESDVKELDPEYYKKTLKRGVR